MTLDAFQRLAMALREQCAQGHEAVDEGQVGNHVRNLLLDACGSDHRPLVELLLLVRHDVSRLLAVHPGAPTADSTARVRHWEFRRAPIVHQLVASRFLQTDIARWLVDSWAYAGGIITDLPASPSLVDAHDSGPLDRSPAARPEKRHTITSPTVSGSTHRGPVASAVKSARGLFGTKTLPATPQLSIRQAARAAASRPMTAVELKNIQRMERVGLSVLAGAVIFGFLAEAYALYARPLDRAPIAPPALGETAQSSDALVSASLPLNDSATLLVPSPVLASPVLPSTGAHDQLISVREVVGRYRVSHRTVSVSGLDGCDAVAAALALQQESIEQIEFGDLPSRIRLVSRNVSGTVGEDGRFEMGPDSGVVNGVRWTFSMQGQFTSGGFTAVTQKTTDATLAWHKQRACGVVAELVGTRLPLAPPR